MSLSHVKPTASPSLVAGSDMDRRESQEANGKDGKAKSKGQTAQILRQVIDFLRAMHDKHEEGDDETRDYFDFGPSRKDEKAQIVAQKVSSVDSSTVGHDVHRSTQLKSSENAAKYWSEHTFKSDSTADVWKTNIAQALELQRASQPRRASLDVEHAAEAFLQAMCDSHTVTPAPLMASPQPVVEQKSPIAVAPVGTTQSPQQLFAGPSRQPMTFGEYLQHPTGQAWLRDLQTLKGEQLAVPTTEGTVSRKRSATEGARRQFDSHVFVSDVDDDASMPPPPSLTSTSAPSSTTSQESLSDEATAPKAEGGDFRVPSFSFEGPADGPDSLMSFEDILARMQGSHIDAGHPPPASTKSMGDNDLSAIRDIPTPVSRPATASARSTHARSQPLAVPMMRSTSVAETSNSAPPALCTSPSMPGRLDQILSPDTPVAESSRAQVPGKAAQQKPKLTVNTTASTKKRGSDALLSTSANKKAKAVERPALADTKKVVVVDRRKRRRESHNAVERRRRDLINERIAEMAALLPQPLLLEAIANSTGGGTAPHIDLSILTQQCTCHTVLQLSGSPVPYDEANGCTGGCRQHDEAIAELAHAKPNKGVVLTKSVEYIKHLHEICATLRRSNGELQTQLDSIRQTLLGNGGGASQSSTAARSGQLFGLTK